MIKLTTAAQMREMDRRTIEEFAVPGIVLMENAALRVVDVLAARFGPLRGKRIAIVCGKGNNGGDGLAVARHLAARFGADVTVWLTASAEAFTGDAAANYQMAAAYGLDMRLWAGALGETALVIDALLGTGISGGVSGELAEVIQAMNDAGKPVVAVDVPSGLDADTGRVDGACVRAALTVTFALPKFGLLVYPGAEYVGELLTVEIGMPRSVMAAEGVYVVATEAVDVAGWVAARVNGRDSNKGKFGHVSVFAGSAGFVGAPVLSTEAAARTGGGTGDAGRAQRRTGGGDGPHFADCHDAGAGRNGAGVVQPRRAGRGTQDRAFRHGGGDWAGPRRRGRSRNAAVCARVCPAVRRAAGR